MNDEERNAGLSRTPGYQYAQVVGDQLFIAGQVPLDGSGDLVGVDEPRQQATACLDNMRTLLGVHGFGIEHVRHITIHVVGRHEHLLRAWEAVVEWFGGEVPPATLLGAHLLGYQGQLVEIDATILRSVSD